MVRQDTQEHRNLFVHTNMFGSAQTTKILQKETQFETIDRHPKIVPIYIITNTSSREYGLFGEELQM